MKPTIIVRDFYQEIHITLGKAVEALEKEGLNLQRDTLLKRFDKAESHGQAMEAIGVFVEIVYQEVS